MCVFFLLNLKLNELMFHGPTSHICCEYSASVLEPSVLVLYLCEEITFGCLACTAT